ncbi:RHS repeat-associated core domain-containing protein [Saccharicrinis sp. 156]|uniref:RHS repeat protein n=1 Tax=Saccharicrinis sp. 156 TaxID=3417574 RepID=UPI003D352D2A
MDNTGNNIYYTLTDHLGSLNTLIDASGNIVEEHAFDSWGKRRDPHYWESSTTTTSSITDRGFGYSSLTFKAEINMFSKDLFFWQVTTQTKHIAELIPMALDPSGNGRTYCPTTMQFVSPDPLIQSPQSTANYNRYSYCMNNPIMYSDPSGYQYYPYQNEVNAINKAQLERWLSMGAPGGGGGGGSIFPKYGVLGSPRNNLEYEKQLAYNLDTREGGSFFTDGLNQRISTFGEVSYIETSKLRRENVQVLDYTLKNGELYLKGTKFFNIYVPSKLTALNPNNANRIAELFGKYNAQADGGDFGWDDAWQYTKTGASVVRGGAAFAKVIETEYVRQAVFNSSLAGKTVSTVPNALGKISAVSKVAGGFGIAASWGIAGYHVANGTDNTSTWVNAGANTLILGAAILGGPITVGIAAGAGIVYGVSYLIYGDEMDSFIDNNFGYR